MPAVLVEVTAADPAADTAAFLVNAAPTIVTGEAPPTQAAVMAIPSVVARLPTREEAAVVVAEIERVDADWSSASEVMSEHACAAAMERRAAVKVVAVGGRLLVR